MTGTLPLKHLPKQRQAAKLVLSVVVLVYSGHGELAHGDSHRLPFVQLLPLLALKRHPGVAPTFVKDFELQQGGVREDHMPDG
jgi:hypothetical protein